MKNILIIIFILLGKFGFANQIDPTFQKTVTTTTFDPNSNVLQICFQLEVDNQSTCTINYSVTDDLNLILSSNADWILLSTSSSYTASAGNANLSGDILTWSGTLISGGQETLSYCLSFQPTDGFTLTNNTFTNAAVVNLSGSCINSINNTESESVNFEKDELPPISACDITINCDKQITTNFLGEEAITGTSVFPNTPTFLPDSYSIYKAKNENCENQVYFNPDSSNNPDNVSIDFELTNCRHIQFKIDALPGGNNSSEYWFNGSYMGRLDCSIPQILNKILPLSGEINLKIRTVETVGGVEIIRYFQICENYNFECTTCIDKPIIQFENYVHCVGDVGVVVMDSGGIYGTVRVLDPNNNITNHDTFAISPNKNRAFIPFPIPGVYKIIFESCMANYNECCKEEVIEIEIEKCEFNDCNTNTLVINTGFDHSINSTVSPGGIDPQWTILRTPSNQTNYMAPRSSFVINPILGWGNTQSNSMWMSGQNTANWATNNGRNSALDPYLFQRDFCTEKDSEVFVAFNVHADNNLKLYITDATGNTTILYDYAISGPGLNTVSNFDSMPETDSQQFNLSINLPPGRHSIIAELYNESGVAMGWNLEGIIQGANLLTDECCEPKVKECKLKNDMKLNFSDYCPGTIPTIDLNSIADGGYIYIDGPGSTPMTTFVRSIQGPFPDSQTYDFFKTPGVYSICFNSYKLENGTRVCEETICQEIKIVEVQPILTVDLNGTCPGSDGLITYGGGTAAELFINGNLVDSFNGGSHNFNYNFPTVGNYVVKAVVRNEIGDFWCEKEISKTVQIVDPTPQINANINCENSTSSFTLNGGDGGDLYINGTWIQSVSGTTGTVNYTFPSAGNYNIRYDSFQIINNNKACPGSKSINVNVPPCNPGCNIDAILSLNSVEYCIGDSGIISYGGGITGRISVTDPNGAVTNYTNLNPPGNQSYVFNLPGAYTIAYSAVDSNPNCTKNSSITVHVNDCEPDNCCENTSISLTSISNPSVLINKPENFVLRNKYNINISNSSVPIKEVRISMVDLEVDYQDEICQNCQENPVAWGSLAVIEIGRNWQPWTMLTSFSTTIMDYTSKESILTGPGGGSIQNSDLQSLHIYFGFPNLNPIGCCSSTVKFCVKVTVIDENCVACEEYFCGEITLNENGQKQITFLGTTRKF